MDMKDKRNVDGITLRIIIQKVDEAILIVIRRKTRILVSPKVQITPIFINPDKGLVCFLLAANGMKGFSALNFSYK